MKPKWIAVLGLLAFLLWVALAAGFVLTVEARPWERNWWALAGLLALAGGASAGWVLASLWWMAARARGGRAAQSLKSKVQSQELACEECQTHAALIRCQVHKLQLCVRCWRMHHVNGECAYDPVEPGSAAQSAGR